MPLPRPDLLCRSDSRHISPLHRLGRPQAQIATSWAKSLDTSLRLARRIQGPEHRFDWHRERVNVLPPAVRLVSLEVSIRWMRGRH